MQATISAQPGLESPPGADTPEQAAQLFVTALNEGRLREATDCFSRQGCMVTPDSTAVHGRAEIQPLLAQLIARRVEVEVTFGTELRAGEVALLRQRWELHSDVADGGRYTQELSASLILHRVEASWKLVIAAPWS
jgi:ketosteroid isomerase-like protein